MNRVLLTIILLLTFTANSVMGASMGCSKTDMTNHSNHSMSMEMNSEASHPDSGVDLATDNQCPNCGQISCESISGCSSCMAHCVGAMITSPYNFNDAPDSVFDSSIAPPHFPSVYFSFLRPPKHV